MRAAAGAISRARARARAHREVARDRGAALIFPYLRVARDADVSLALFAALKVEVAGCLSAGGAQGCAAGMFGRHQS